MSEIRVVFQLCLGKPQVMSFLTETVLNLSRQIGSVWLQPQSYSKFEWSSESR